MIPAAPSALLPGLMARLIRVDLASMPNTYAIAAAAIPARPLLRGEDVFGLSPLALLGGGAALALVAAAAAGWAYARPRRVLLTVDGERRTMVTRTGATQPVYDKAGNRVADLRTTLFGHQLTVLGEGAQVRLGWN